MEQLKQALQLIVVPIHPAGWMFVAIAAVIAVILGMFADGLLYLGLILTVFVAYFFRDPPRVAPAREDVIIAPADGKVVAITKTAPPSVMGLGDSEYTRVSIFLSPFDVHVNRAPIAGTVEKLHYTQGAFLNASLDKASEQNERQHITIAGNGVKIGVVQIAGLIARRIVCDLEEGQSVALGARFGIIRFGSRVDLYLPAQATCLVAVGQRMVGGETVVATF